MFFKKNNAAPAPPDLGPLFIAIATELYRGIGPADGSASLTAVLEFDELQRVGNIKNPMIDGKPKIPPFDTMENLNKLITPLKALPKQHQLKSLTISIINGQINAQAEYAK